MAGKGNSTTPLENQTPLPPTNLWETGPLYHGCEAADAETNGLRALSRKCAKKSSELKLMKKMTEEGLGTHEVEQLAWKLQARREAQKGNTKLRKMKKGNYERDDQRDRDYVKKEMKIRTSRMKMDLKEMEKKLENGKQSRLREARTDKERNSWKREMKRMARVYSQEYTLEESKNKKRLEETRKKVSRRTPLTARRRKAEVEKEFQDWIGRMCLVTEEKPQEPEIPTYGEPSTDEDEKAALRLPLNFVLYAKVQEEDSTYESVLANTKSRWSRKTNGSPEEQELEEETNGPQEPPSDEEIVRDNEEREIFNPTRNTLDFRRLRATDLRDCPRLCLPGPRPQREEALLHAKEVIWQETISNYRRNNCREDGTQLKDNVTKSERRGINKLRRRAKAGEIVISSTDKSGKLTISSMDSYLRQGAPHVAGDRKITMKEVRKTQEDVLNHTKMLSEIFMVGQDHGQTNEERLRRAMHEKSTIIPPLVLQQKDHKAIKDGIPAVRPVCEASRTINQRMSDMLTDVLQAEYATGHTTEAISTEDFLSKIEGMNHRIRKGEIDSENLTIGSLDVAALYPSIDTKQASRICRDRLMASEMKIEGLNYTQALVYLKLTMKPAEVVDMRLQGLLPRRVTRQGPNPTLRSHLREPEKNRWWFPKKIADLTEKEKKTTAACVIQQMILATFQSHVYEWDGNIYQQADGGPIGLRSTQPVARILMDYWAETIQEISEKTQALKTLNPVQFESLTLEELIKYVDDCLVAIKTLKWGCRWCPRNKVLTWDKESEDLDRAEGKNLHHLTLEIFTKMAESVTTFLKFTWDAPDKNASGEMPVLDTTVWLQRENRSMGVPREILGESDPPDNLGRLRVVLITRFYQKPMACRVPNLAKNALPEQQKVTNVTSEVIRRLKTTSRDLLMEVIEEVLSTYMGELEAGGYGPN